MDSILQHRGQVTMPQFTGERVYMRPIRKGALPFDLQRWQPTVDAMLAGIDVAGPMYLMIDQSVVEAGSPQRRPGLHIDGYWVPALQAHEQPGKPGHRHGDCESHPEAILLASDVSASRAFTGRFDTTIGAGGDCSHLSTQGLTEVRLQAGQCYAGNVSMLHESLPVAHTTPRTLVRINVPGWEPQGLSCK
jgi:hypothetical protein